jgi:hypothetical protein
MIKLIDILKEVIEDLEIPQEAYTGKIYSNSPNIWTHVSKHDGVIEDIKRKNKWISRGENLDHFVYGTQHMQGKKFYLSKDNKNSVYMKKGSLYISEPNEKYPIKWLITADLPDDSFQPNINGGNTDTLEQSHNIGVLKPEYRDIKNFKFYRFNPTDKKWYEFDIDKIK